MKDDTRKSEENRVDKKLAALLVFIALVLVAGGVYLLFENRIDQNKQPTPEQQSQTKVTEPKQVKDASKELEDIDRSLQNDLDTTELEQDIDILL